MTVTAKNPVEPVAGGVVSFAVHPSAIGASATLGSATATIDATGTASVSATANFVAGSYTAFASDAEVATPSSFALTNTPASLAGFAVSWGTAGNAALNLPASAGGLILPAGRKTDLPWLGIDQFTLTLNTPARCRPA